MFSKASASLLLLSTLVPSVLGHSFLEKLWASGVEYKAWSPNEGFEGTPYPSNTPSWYTTNVGGNPLKPIKANTNDIICALNATPAQFAAPINAGQTVTVKWWQAGIPFPNAHWGPIIDYIAACNGPCATVNKADLKFVKIAQRGWINPTTYPQGFWATNQMIADNGTWPVRVPSNLKAGEYVIRHELIALHVANNAIGQGDYPADGAEFYPQCVTIKVPGTGTKVITGGVDARTLYKGSEPGLAINIHTTNMHWDYQFPGPAVWSGA